MNTLLYFLLLFNQFTPPAQDATEYFKSFDNTRIAFTDEGSGEVVLLIHGFISSGSSWNQTVLKKELLEKGYRVIVPDLRGNGKSDKPQNAEAYTNDAEVKDLMALAKHLKLKTYTAIGYSRGSIVLAKLLTQEKRINTAVLGGMGLDFTDPNWSRRVMFANAFSGRSITPETSSAVNYAKSIGADLKILGFLQDYQPVTTTTELNKIIIPTLIISGNEDKENGSPLALKQQLPNSSILSVKGDHNNTYKENSFAVSVLMFLKDH